MNSSKK